MREAHAKLIKTLLDKYDKKLGISSSRDKPDYYYLVKDGKVIARVYKKKEKWFIWYESINAKFKVANFTTAKAMLEEEFPCMV